MLFMVVLLNRNLFLSFIFASMTYYLLAPIVDWVERKGLSRSLATAVPFVGLAIFVVVGLQLIIPMMADQAQSLNIYMAGASGKKRTCITENVNKYCKERSKRRRVPQQHALLLHKHTRRTGKRTCRRCGEREPEMVDALVKVVRGFGPK